MIKLSTIKKYNKPRIGNFVLFIKNRHISLVSISLGFCLTTGNIFAMMRQFENAEFPSTKRVKEETVTLVNNEEAKFTVPLSVAQQSSVIASMSRIQHAGQPIKLDVNTFSLFIITRALPYMRYIKNGDECEVSNYLKSIINFLGPVNLFNVLKSSIELGIDDFAEYLCDFIYNKLKNSIDLDEISTILKNLASLNQYFKQKIESWLYLDAIIVYQDSCKQAGALPDQIIMNPHSVALSVFLIKLNQLDPTKVVMDPYLKQAIGGANLLRLRSYYYGVILKNRPIIGTRSHWFPEHKVSVSIEIGNVTLVANDEKGFTVARSTAEFSQTLKNMIEELGTANPIPFKDINSDQLSLIIESLKKIEEIGEIGEWGDKGIDLDRLFVGKSYEFVIETLKAANYLDIPILVEYITTLIVSQTLGSNTADVSNLSVLCCLLEALPSELRLLIVERLKKDCKEELAQFLDKPVRTFQHHEKNVASLSFTNDDKKVLIRTVDRKLYLWDGIKGNALKQLNTDPTSVNYPIYPGDNQQPLALNRKGTLVLITSGRVLCLWDLEKGEKVKEFRTLSFVLSLSISPDDKYALTGSKNGKVHLRDLSSGEIVKSLNGHNSQVIAVTFIADGKQALTGSSDKTIILWDLTTDQIIKKIECDDKRDVKSIIFSADGKKALVAAGDKFPYLQDLESGIIKELQYKGYIYSTAMSTDGKAALLATGTGVCLWDLETGKIREEFNNIHRETVAFSLDSKLMLTGTTGKAEVFDLSIADQLMISRLILFIMLNRDASKMLNCPYFKTVFDGLSPYLKQLIRDQHKSIFNKLAF